MNPRCIHKGEDITWVVDQIVKVFKLLKLHLDTKKRPFPNNEELDNIFNRAENKVKEVYHGEGQ